MHYRCLLLSANRAFDLFRFGREVAGYDRQFADYSEPTEFYKSWQGDIGRSNLCANILDQMSRLDLAEVVRLLPSATDDGEPLTLADVGCASAAQIFPYVSRYQHVHLLDLPNINQDFIKWRAQAHGYNHISTGGGRYRKPGQHHDALMYWNISPIPRVSFWSWIHDSSATVYSS